VKCQKEMNTKIAGVDYAALVGTPAPPVEPVSEENREDYEKIKSIITDLLNTVH